MGPLRKRRFCARSGQGSSARIRVEASSIKTKTTSGGKDEQGVGEGPPGGGRLPPEQRSSRESEGQKQGFLLQHFPSGQEGRRAQASHKPEWTQRLHQEKDFSNGFTERRISISAQGRLGCHYRPERRLPARPHSGAAQTLSPILVEGQQLSVQETALRTEFSSANVHEAHPAFSDPVPGQWGEDYRLPGRFSGTRPFQAGTASSHETGAGHSRESRFSEKPQEVSLGAKTALRVSWAPVGYKEAKGLPTRGQDQRLQAVRTHSTLQPQSSLGPKIFGQGDLCSPGRTVGPDVPATTPDGSNKSIEVGSTGPQQRGQGIDTMVDSTSYRWYGFDAIQHTDSHDHGRIQLWMGSDHGREKGQRQMVGRGEEAPHQPLGTPSCFQGSSRISETPEEQEGNGASGQCYGGCLPCEGRRDPVRDVKCTNDGDTDLLQRPWYCTEPSLSARHSKLGSRRPFQGDRDEGMVHKSEGLGEDLQSSWTSTDRSICIKEIGSGEDVLLPGLERQSFGRDECVKSVMDVQTHVRLPSASGHSSDSGQDEGIQGNFDLGDTLLVEGSLVAGAASDGGSGTSSPSSTPEHSEGSEHGETPPIVAETEVDGLAHMRETFRGQGADNTLAEFICGSWRGSTKTQYACAWRNWSEWCRGFAIPRTTPTVGQFLKYLWFLYDDRHMAWSTIRVHRAAVATILDPLTNSPLSQHPMVCRFMKAVFLARPPPRKVKPIWSVSTVLEMLRSWGNPDELSRQKLTWRVAMLLALASARRASDLSLLHIDEDHLFKTNDSWRFHLVFGAKQDRPGHIPQDVIISKQACRELCPLENLREYLRRTEGERGGHMQLFRTTVQPLKPASKQTIRSWLSKVLDSAGILAPGGSTRAAAATWAAAKAVPISTIMAAADWSCIKTMANYYIRPLPQGASASEHISVQRALLGDI